MMAVFAFATGYAFSVALAAERPQSPALGPLRIHPENPRFFTDGTKKPDGSLSAVYLTGSHHWHNLQDAGRIGKPITRVFDYVSYLARLQKWNHNFIRFWAWEGAAWWYQGGQNDEFYKPSPYKQAGAVSAGHPIKFDLTQFNPDYFARLRSRVSVAGERGMYVSIMLFQGWSIYSHGYGNPWPLHPYNKDNNVNGIDGDADRDGEGKEVHSLKVPAVTRLQEAYIRKVVDTVNDLDNVLYEVTNETALYSKDWQYHVIRYLKDYQRTKPKQHPVGITAFDSGGKGSMNALFDSPADWISPQNDGESGDYMSDPPAADGRKVIISDTDHLWGVGGSPEWVWKSLARGMYTIYMDPLRKPEWVRSSEAEMESTRKSMGYARLLVERMNLAKMTPQPKLASTRYCLAYRGVQYLVIQPKSGAPFSVNLPSAAYRYEWFNVQAGAFENSGELNTTNGAHEFKPPFAGLAVLRIERR